MTQPLATLHLELNSPPDGSVDAKDIRTSLSAVIQVGRHLWLGCDETATLERLTDLGGGRWGDHRTFKLADVLDLPGADDDEVDVEGLAWDPPYLWIAGSHGRKRDKPDPDDGDVEAFAKCLADVDLDENRYLLARIPLEDDPEHGGLTPRRSCPDPRDPSVTLTAARLKGRGPDSALMRALRKDPHLRKFIKLPGKDNGFDVEGLSAAGGRLFLGLRGPVLRGWAIVLELLPEEGKKKGRLELARIGPEGRRYRKHFLDLDGLGVRELSHQGDDMLVLAGPTMDVHAPAAVFLWRGAVSAEDDSVGAGKNLRRFMELPHDVEGPGDHPEGMCRFRAEGMDADGLLVVYDSPSRRRQARGGLRADVFPLTSGGGPAGAPPRRGGGGLLGTVVSALAEAMAAGGHGRPPSEGGPGGAEEGPPPSGKEGAREDRPPAEGRQGVPEDGPPPGGEKGARDDAPPPDAEDAPDSPNAPQPRDDDGHPLPADVPAEGREDDGGLDAPHGDDHRAADEGQRNQEEGQG
jgi:hypothetical protein